MPPGNRLTNPSPEALNREGEKEHDVLETNGGMGGDENEGEKRMKRNGRHKMTKKRGLVVSDCSGMRWGDPVPAGANNL